MDILKKIQSLSLSTRKIIFWAILIFLGLGLLSWYLKSFEQRIDNLNEKKSNEKWRLLPSLEELKISPQMPKIELPQNNENKK